MNIIKPEKLKKGDTIGILAVSGKIKEIEKIENAKKFLQDAGYNVVISDTCYSFHRYMAGICDDECASNLHKFFMDESIDAILCARGGYGTLRLINKIDWDVIRNNPKIFAGYSDITNLLAMMYKKCGLITFHSAMASGDFGSEINEYTKNGFFNALEWNTNEFVADDSTCFKDGEAKGILWGGNLSSLVSLCGLDFVPEEDIILFLEDLNEPVYKIDKMLTQLFNVEELRSRVKGLAIGEFKDIEDKDELNDLLSEFASSLNVPMCDGFKFTHSKVKDTLPYGATVKFNAFQGVIEIKL